MGITDWGCSEAHDKSAFQIGKFSEECISKFCSCCIRFDFNAFCLILRSCCDDTYGLKLQTKFWKKFTSLGFCAKRLFPGLARGFSSSEQLYISALGFEDFGPLGCLNLQSLIVHSLLYLQGKVPKRFYISQEDSW